MNKQEFRELVESKITLQKGEFDNLWQEKEQELKDVQLSPEQKEQAILNKLYAYFSKQLNNKAETYEGVILGYSDITDYGATKLFNNAKTTWEKASPEIKELLKKGGQYDELGNPIWSKENTKVKWKYENQDGTMKPTAQRKIDVEREQQRQVLLVAKKKEDANYKVARMTLLSDKLNLQLPLKQKVSFRANGKVDNGGVYRLTSASVTSFVAFDEPELSHDDVLELINMFFKQNVVDFNTSLPSTGLQTTAQLVVVINATVTRATMTGANSRNNVINISSLLGGLSQKEEVTCWVSKEQQLNVVEGDSNIVVFGTPMRGSENLSLNVLGIFSPNVFVKPLPIEVKSETLDDTQGW